MEVNMRHRAIPGTLRTIIPIIVLLGLMGAALVYLYRVSAAESAGPLRASGTVEAVEVHIAPELSGRVADVMVKEGDTVQAGDVLFRLDDEVLQAQRRGAEAAVQAARAGLRAAQANLDRLRAGPRPEEIAQAEAAVQAAQARLDRLIHGPTPEQIASARQAVAVAQANLERVKAGPTAEQLIAAEAQVKLAEAALKQAHAAYDPIAWRPDIALLPQSLQMEQATIQYEQAKANYENLLKGPRPEDIKVAQQQVAQAQAALNELLAGARPEDVAAAQAEVQAAQARLALVKAGARPEEIAAAQAQVDAAQANLAQAQAQLELIDVQLKKLVVRAPAHGTVVARSIEPGEVVQAGAAVLTLGQLDDLTITVYIPEDRYGQIHLGARATVTVDSFPGETFEATVTHIADRAEFTPRNVQTEAGRRTTVFAVKLSVSDPAGRLKPGMPADVQF
jgi:multidrug resistance efflux pump